MLNEFLDLYIVIVLCTILLIIILCSVWSQLKNLNHNLYFVFKANWMIWDVDEDSILFTKLDEDVKSNNSMNLL